MDVWVVGEMVNLTRRTARADDPSIYDAQRGAVRLFAAANETVSFQIVIDAGKDGADGVRLAWNDLEAAGGLKIETANLQAFRGVPVRVSEYPPWYLRLVDDIPSSTDFYDALIPLDAPQAGQPYRLPPQERMLLWVDVYVPRDAKAGDYAGSVTVRSGPTQQRRLELALKVYEFVLPDARPLAAVGGFDHDVLYRTFIERNGRPFLPVRMDARDQHVQQGLALMRQLIELAHAHRLDLFDRTIRPELRRDLFGKVQIVWDDYDAVVLPYLKGTAFEDRIGCPAWPVPFSEDWPNPSHYGGPDDEAYATVVGSLLAESRKHFTSDIDTRDRMFLWPYRGAVDGAAYGRYAHLARLARAADAETPLLCPLPPEPPKMTGWQAPKDLDALADILAPPGEYLDPALGAKRARGDQPLTGAWLSPGLPPYLPSLGVIATAADVRAIPWFAMKYRCAGLFLPEVLNWPEDPFVTPAGAETRLFYPGRIAGIEGVLPSIRLKRLRRGLQDIVYLWLLRQRQRGGLADAILHSMTRYAALDAVGDNYLDPRLDGWVQDAETWQMARRLLAEEVQAAVYPVGQSNQELLEQRLKWKKFDDSAHSLRVEQVRARVAPAEQPNRLRATVLLDLYNEYSRSVDAVVRLGDLPEGWKAVAGEVSLSPFPAATRRVVTLVAEGAYVPAGNEAKMSLPVSLTTDMQSSRTLAVAVPFLRAGAVASPPIIDGRLDDWPMRPGNTAAAFRLIGRRGQKDDGRALRQTLAFVLYDARNLYIAFRCAEPNPAGMVARPNNILHYEQLMACGEDLVEVILDPGADARGPEDLYHIAVKPNGVLLTEQGVHTDPPLGGARPWPVAASVAVSKEQDVWIVELAIPLSAFGAEGGSKFWAVNFTRFATQGAEASSWSEAPRYFYDPRNLGTMLVVPLAGEETSSSP